jgi:hypothetical protein
MKTKSARRGRGTLAVEVTNVSPHGVWILMDDRERFLAFKDFPWFADATIAEITNVERPAPHHLHWPDLDVDLAVESIDRPTRYPLVSREPRSMAVREPRRATKPKA